MKNRRFQTWHKLSAVFLRLLHRFSMPFTVPCFSFRKYYANLYKSNIIFCLLCICPETYLQCCIFTTTSQMEFKLLKVQKFNIYSLIFKLFRCIFPCLQYMFKLLFLSIFMLVFNTLEFSN